MSRRSKKEIEENIKAMDKRIAQMTVIRFIALILLSAWCFYGAFWGSPTQDAPVFVKTYFGQIYGIGCGFFLCLAFSKP